MAKKSRSVASKAAPTFAGIQRSGPTMSTEFNPDYTGIKHELKRIGILAAGGFALLIVLSFIIK